MKHLESLQLESVIILIPYNHDTKGEPKMFFSQSDQPGVQHVTLKKTWCLLSIE